MRHFTAIGLKTGCVLSIANSMMIEGVKTGKYQLVYFTPEALLEHIRWRKLLRTEVYSTRLRVLIIDEAHTVMKW